MSNTARPTIRTADGRGREAAGLLGTVVCSVVLALVHLVSGYVTWLAYLIEPDGFWDTDAAGKSDIAAGIGMGIAVFGGLLTLAFVKAGWLRTWWYALPVALAVAVLLRLTVLAPEL